MRFLQLESWPNRLRIGRASSDGDELLLWVTNRCQTAAKNTARIDVNGSIQPIGLRNRGVAHRSP